MYFKDTCVLLNIYVCACVCVWAENGLFGVPLAILLEQDQRRVPGTKVPFILQKVRHEQSNIAAMDKEKLYNSN